ncbi:efflux RND transporter periplasmic adaptor subunit [Oxalobacter formigenes]|uniref:Multidrug efflux periplasmic linker protein BpeA n=1 Tax=Oxalobacter formigenes OXCC13 TaxID=556269 RepID=C3X7D1_OXAFO|nr:efflux RND transporter periplasmic adaptor subunit [Oxalobacter formigenes]ARQ46882.1 Multidrug efflux pump subunit AcrA [Oxalobacter formigenes]ARQ78930.1 MexE family multidrug efflux RND transporter periplasmic adaptor subunit [Oxalobacter formigenes OXCC13]EEO29107.1 multidrug efflux periplasmic linker protein BpeA [Oxalobacter formigenes OXCC13]MCZ4063320.1 efflux RND transporter periplasmic adaptor subunit [Oxalobacter formigenes]QDX32482.1 efflux RND transporter periplasmic adaptor su
MRSISCLKSVGAALIAVSLLSACGDKAAPPAQLPEAAYVTIAPEKRAVENELPGRLESYRTAEVRARVPGIVLKRTFEEGAFVKQGQVLFKIDPRSYQASVQNAKAALSRAEANKVQADLKLKRYKPLVEINAISKQEYDDAIAAAKQASADVEAAKATLVNNKLNLEYATVTAPISGRIGRAMVTEGALVGQNEATLLATIQQINPIYLNLTQSSAELLKLRQMMQSGALKDAEKSGLKVTMVMEDGSIYPHTGKLLFSDISVDPTTGELALRALFPNPDNMLLPGMFVRARLEQAVNENAITVPQQAVQHTNDGSQVIVINQENKAEIRQVKTTSAIGNRWLVTEGLQPGDRVIVEGLQKVRPGSPVNPVEWVDPMAPAKAPAETPAAAAPATEAGSKAADGGAAAGAAEGQAQTTQAK